MYDFALSIRHVASDMIFPITEPTIYIDLQLTTVAAATEAATKQARTQPVSKGGYIVVQQWGGGGGGGEITPLIVYFNNSYAVLSPPRGGLGTCSPRKFWKFRLPESIYEAF